MLLKIDFSNRWIGTEQFRGLPHYWRDDLCVQRYRNCLGIQLFSGKSCSYWFESNYKSLLCHQQQAPVIVSGNHEQKKKYLTRMIEEPLVCVSVESTSISYWSITSVFVNDRLMLSRNRALVRTLPPSRPGPRGKETITSSTARRCGSPTADTPTGISS